MHLLVILVHLAGVVHGAELRSAHGAEGRRLVSLFGQSLVVHRASRLRIKRKFKLFFPIEFIASVAQRVVTVARSRPLAGDVSGMSCDLVSDDSIFHIFFIWQPEMFFRSYVAEHRGAK